MFPLTLCEADAGSSVALYLGIAVSVCVLLGAASTLVISVARMASRLDRNDSQRDEIRSSVKAHSGEITRLSAALGEMQRAIAVSETKHGHIERQLEQLNARVEAMPERIAEILGPMLRGGHDAKERG